MEDITFKRDGGRIYAGDDAGKVIAEVSFPKIGDNLVDIDHTYVDSSMSGRGIAGQLLSAAYDAIKSDGCKCVAGCSYAQKWFRDHPDKCDIMTE